MGARGDRGQVSPLLALVVMMAALGMVLVARVGASAADRARARTAADAAALAGARGGRDAAMAFASANDALLLQYVSVDGVVEVTVRLGGSTATARAER